MKKLTLTLATSVLFITSTHAQFTAGTLTVVKLGNGTETLGNAGNTVSLIDFSLSGSPLYTLTLPNTTLVMSGTSSSEGSLSRSANGNYLTLAGYRGQTLPYAGSLPNVSASTVNRGVVQVDISGSYTSPTYSTTRFGGSTGTSGNFRSVVTDGNGVNWWGVGTASSTSSSGTLLLNTPGPSTTMINAGPSPRVANIFNNSLFYSTSTGIFTYNGLPTTTSTPTQIITTTGVSPYDFAINAAGNVAYIADSTLATGGIQKWTYNGSTWSYAYTVGAGRGINGLAWDGYSSTLFGTTTEASNNALVRLIDGGVGSLSTSDIELATAGANQIFKGLDFGPGAIPEPTTFALLGLGLFMFAGRLRRAS
jgi:hypothetical protein